MLSSWDLRDRLGSQWAFNFAGATSNEGWIYRREILDKFKAMGIHHCRSYLLPRSKYVTINGVQVTLTSHWMIDKPTYFHSWLEEMSSKGIKHTFPVGRPYTASSPIRTPSGDYHPWWGTPQGLVNAAKSYGSNCVAGEAPNEYDEPKVSYDIISPWNTTLKAWLARVGPLWDTAFGSGTPYIGPSFGNVDEGTPSLLGNVTAYTDRKNAHPYSGNKVYKTEWLDSQYATLEPVNPGQKIWATEFGVTVNPTAPTGWNVATEADQAVLLVKQYLTMFAWGIERAFVFNFYDPRASTQNFSLLLGDPVAGFRERPAYKAFKKLFSLCDATKPTSAAPAELRYTLTGLPTDAKTMVVWKANGDYLLFIWREAPLKTAPVNLTLTFPDRALKTSYDIVGTQNDCPKNEPVGKSYPIVLGDHPLVYRV